MKWVRGFYDDFGVFVDDQELLVSIPELVDYVEGFIVPNEESLFSSYAGFPVNLDFTLQFEGQVYYCLEFAIHDYSQEAASSGEVSEVINHLNRLI